jgi:hypothetical protein
MILNALLLSIAELINARKHFTSALKSHLIIKSFCLMNIYFNFLHEVNTDDGSIRKALQILFIFHCIFGTLVLID